MKLNRDTVEELLENLENQDDIAVIRLADCTDVLAGLEVSELINVIQNLAGRLEDVLNTIGLSTSDQMPPWPLDETDEESDDRRVVEYNG